MDDLKPCDFCGAGETRIEEHRLPPTMKGPGAITSVTIRHFCAGPDILPKCSITVRGRDHAQAFEKWNTRTPPPGYALVRMDGAEDRVAHIVEAGIDLQSGHQAIAREIIRAMTEGE